MAPEYRHFIDGKNVDSSEHYDIIYPYTGETVGTVARAGEAEMDAAIGAATRAFAATRKLSRAERAAILLGISRGVAERRAEFEHAITIDTGKPIDYSRGEVGRTIGVFALAAEEAKRFGGEYEPLDLDPLHPGAIGMVERFPLGPIAAIAPFNFPLNLVTHKVAPAIATGNTIVVKPPPMCPAPALMLAEIACAAGLPPGALNVISAEPPVAERLATDDRIRMLSFTGSARVGWALKAKTTHQRVALELGGNGGLIVDETADVAVAAARAARGAFIHAGQVCLSVQRIFVHRGVYREFLKHFVAETEKLGVGDPMNERTIVGPLINRAAADRVIEWIAEAAQAGAGILTGNKREGAVVWPTIVELRDRKLHRLRVWCEEVFGPVATVEPIDSFEEGIALTNDSPYGLQAGVFTNNLERAFTAFREIEAGAVIVGDTGVFRVDTYPFGGVKGSGIGREGLRYAMQEMTEPRMLVLNLPRRK
ncbi:MAG: aldehyde dehydrogenase family protein [Candidatus Binataceae bacterium]